MADVHEVLVLDEDGQLLDVVELLREFEADFLHSDAPPGSYTGSAPGRLVVATARHALAFEPGPKDAAAGGSDVVGKNAGAEDAGAKTSDAAVQQPAEATASDAKSGTASGSGVEEVSSDAEKSVEDVAAA